VGDGVGCIAVVKETTNYCCYQELEESYCVQASFFTDGSIMGLLPINQLNGAVLGKLMALINK
jgi:hypothetical protein